jgi:hypothetical protein
MPIWRQCDFWRRESDRVKPSNLEILKNHLLLKIPNFLSGINVYQGKMKRAAIWDATIAVIDGSSLRIRSASRLHESNA